MDIRDYLAAPLQLDKICRGCLAEKCDMKPLYGGRLDEIFNSFASIQAQHDDGLPSLLCEQCVLQCSNAYSFKKLCEKSDCILREFIKLEFRRRLQDPVMPTSVKVELDEACEVDQYDEMARSPIKEEIEPEFVSCTDLEAKSDQKTIKQADKDKPLQLFVRLEPHRAAKAPLAFKKAKLETNAKIHLENKLCDINRQQIKRTNKLMNTDSASFSCSVCDKQFKLKSSLSRHMKYHTGPNFYCCTYCNMKFGKAKNLRIHIRSHMGERTYACDICQKTFTRAWNLEKHIRVHTGEKPYHCPICEKGFTQSGYVSIHMRTHTGVKPHICETCGKAYTGLDKLKVHKRLHTGEKPYSCKTCGKCFRGQEILNQHTNIHTGVKSYFCDVCGRGFNNSGSLWGHRRTHTGVQPHECSVCDKKFKDAIQLAVHMKSHSKEKKEQNQETKL